MRMGVVARRRQPPACKLARFLLRISMNIRFYNVVMEEFDGEKHGLIRLDNGLEISIVQNGFSYGGKQGLYEMGAMKPDGGMVYIEEWQDQVKGWLTPEDIDKELEMLQRKCEVEVFKANTGHQGAWSV